MNLCLILDSIDCIKNNLDNLFSNANAMHPNDLYADFKTIMKVGDKVLKQSGKFDNLFIMYYIWLFNK